MNHQPFETWIISAKDALTPEEKNKLQDHVTACERCKILADSQQKLDAVFQNANFQPVTPGFFERWQVDFKKRKRIAEQQRRQSITLLIVFGSILLLAASYIGVTFFPFRDDFSWVARCLIFIFFQVNVILSAILTLSRTLSPLLFWGFWIVTSSLFTFIAALWGFSMYRIVLQGAEMP